MENYHQMTIQDAMFQQTVDKLPKRLAYIDETGSFGFDFSTEGASKYYILTAIVVEIDKLKKLHTDFEEIKKTNGLAKTELKSSKVPEGRRERIMLQLMPLEFNIVLFIADKQKFYKDSPLTKYKPVFIKNMDNRIYAMLYGAYPKLRIMMDKVGWSEFQDSFKKYVEDRRGQTNLFNQYDFEFVDSKDEILIQMADFIGGSIMKQICGKSSKNYLEMLKGKITAIQRFPSEYAPYWGNVNSEDYKYDKAIYALAVKKARDYIEANKNDESDVKKVQVAVLRYLLFYVSCVNFTQYVYSDELIRNAQNFVDRKVTRDFLFRQVIAPLRDSGVILASCVHGYKIPISVEDINTYLNQTTSIVGPMMQRMGKCRQLIKEGTSNDVDVFNDPAFLKYKRYFDD